MTYSPAPTPIPPPLVYTVNEVTTIWISVCLTFLTYSLILEFDCILLNILPPTFDPDSFWASVKVIWLWDSRHKYHYLEEAWVWPGRGAGSFYVIGTELFRFMTCVFISPDS